MSILFRVQHQQAAQASRRLEFLFWFGMLGTHILYLFIFALVFLLTINFYNYSIAPNWGKIDPHTLPIIRAAFFLALIPTIVVLLVYQEQLFLFRSRSAAEIGFSLGAKPLNPRQKSEYRLQQIVEEMRLASGVKAPELLVFPRDTSINAFLFAGGENSLALGVSQGALDHLSRDELQAVVAHQFGHLRDGFLPIFTRLAAMTAAYSAIENYCSSESVASAGLERNLFSNPLRDLCHDTAIGAFFALFGRLFYQYGLWLQGAFARERIKMGDARAVQYTRYPEALEMAFKKSLSLQLKEMRRVFPPRHFAHLFFHHQEKTAFAAQQTHPSLEERIALLGGTICTAEKEALLFEMEEDVREKSEISPSQRYRALFADQVLLYPLLSVDRLTKSDHLPPPADPAAALLAYFVYHSGASLQELAERNILLYQTLTAIQPVFLTFEDLPPLVQLSFLPRLCGLAAKSCPVPQQLTSEIKKLIALDRQMSAFEACGWLFWQAAISPQPEKISLPEARDALSGLFSFLVVDNKDGETEYRALIQQFFPQNPPAFLPQSVPLLTLCQFVSRLRGLSRSNRQMLADAIEQYYRQHGKIPLRHAYFRYTFSRLLRQKHN